MKKGAVPLKLTCEKIELIYGDDGTVSESIDESATIVTDDSDFITQVYQEMTDMIDASRAYEANATAFSASKSMALQGLELGK
jgi:flagellar basal-body rod protein FlgC